MFFFKKSHKEPSYTEEGTNLYNMLLEKNEWQYLSEKCSNGRKIYFIFHYKSGIKVRADSYYVEVKVSNSDFCSSIFNDDDRKRIIPQVGKIVQYLTTKPVIDILVKFGKISSCSES